MAIIDIAVAKAGSSLSVRITDATHPQSVTGVVWHYGPGQEPLGDVGDFGTGHSDVPLGGPTVIDAHFFLIEGAVLHFNDTPNSPYRVVVSVLQDGKAVHEQVASSGTIGDKNIPFTYTFRVRAV